VGWVFKEALNDALRSALIIGGTNRARPFKLRTYRMGLRPDVALDRALAFAAGMEDEELVRKLNQRK
jgi:hypothetical protein